MYTPVYHSFALFFFDTRPAISVRQLRHDRMEQGPSEPNAGRGTFLLSSGGAGGGYYSVAVDTGRLATEHQSLCRTLGARLFTTFALVGLFPSQKVHLLAPLKPPCRA